MGALDLCAFKAEDSLRSFGACASPCVGWSFVRKLWRMYGASKSTLPALCKLCKAELRSRNRLEETMPSTPNETPELRPSRRWGAGLRGCRVAPWKWDRGLKT